MVINTAMTVGLLPITGMTLPLVSYGGSSLLMTSFSLGLCIGVALQSETTDPGEEPFRFLT
jgi:cell division protein FtsW (lipid II flippase)